MRAAADLPIGVVDAHHVLSQPCVLLTSVTRGLSLPGRKPTGGCLRDAAHHADCILPSADAWTKEHKKATHLAEGNAIGYSSQESKKRSSTHMDCTILQEFRQEIYSYFERAEDTLFNTVDGLITESNDPSPHRSSSTDHVSRKRSKGDRERKATGYATRLQN